jgi:hypothetical protein
MPFTNSQKKKEYNKKWKGRNPTYHLEYDRIRRSKYRKEYNLYSRNYRLQNKEKVLARKRVYIELRSGRMKKKPCFCGSLIVEGHHNYYSKPLEVIWFCKKHHDDHGYYN